LGLERSFPAGPAEIIGTSGNNKHKKIQIACNYRISVVP